MHVSLKYLFQLSPTLTTLVWSRLKQSSLLDPTNRVDETAEEVVVATAETVDRPMPIISVFVGKNIVDNSLIDSGFGVKVITKEGRQ